MSVGSSHDGEGSEGQAAACDVGRQLGGGLLLVGSRVEAGSGAGVGN